MLPLLFVLCSFPVFAATSTASYTDLYRVFHMPLSEVPGWLKKNKGDRLKDLFLARYHLPLTARGAMQRVPLDIARSYNEGYQYATLYIEAPKKETFFFLLSGILKGTIAVNGEQKGTLSPAHPFDHSTIELTLEPGVYSVLFAFEPLSCDGQFILLTDRAITYASRGFTRNFRSTLKVREHPCPKRELAEWLYERRIFPFSQDDDHTYAATRTVDDPEATVENDFCEKTPLLVLLRHAKDRKAREMLSGIGFDEKALEWWDLFLGKGKKEDP
ncbi:MAG TPA: hypothetical protein PKH10_08000 [bacterium]|nr:hypothetical protein [bacterium]